MLLPTPSLCTFEICLSTPQSFVTLSTPAHAMVSSTYNACVRTTTSLAPTADAIRLHVVHYIWTQRIFNNPLLEHNLHGLQVRLQQVASAPPHQ